MSTVTAKQNIKAIVAAIKAEEKSLRARYSMLNWQNGIAMMVSVFVANIERENC